MIMRARATHRLRRSIVACATSGLLISGSWLAGSGSADATPYRFWTYWSGGTAWTFSSVGATRVPADGTVEGWRFSVSEAASSSKAPRHRPSFASVCASTPPHSGSKRVGLVVDYGTVADAPPGQSPPAAVVTHCAVVPANANGYAVIADFSNVRIDQGLVCGISGYPATGCGEPVRPTAQPTRSASSTPTTATKPKPTSETSAATTTRNSAKASPRPSATGQPKSSNTTTTAAASAPSPASLSPTPIAAGSPTTPTNTSGPSGVIVAMLAVTCLGVLAYWLAARRRA